MDLTTVEAALLSAVPWINDQQVRYSWVRAVNHAACTHWGEGKPDARDAKVITDQSCMPADLPVPCPSDDLVAELRRLCCIERRMIEAG